jgi:hypothetical protein
MTSEVLARLRRRGERRILRAWPCARCADDWRLAAPRI